MVELTGIGPNTKEPEDYAKLKQEKEEVEKKLSRCQNEVVDRLENDIKRLNRVIEIKKARIETLVRDLTLVREERTRYRESLGDLMAAIDQWKIKTGLY